jgi:hypothetical protein
MDVTADMPVITVAEIEAMGDEAWDNVLDRIERENRPFLLRDEARVREVVILPYDLWREMKARAGELVIETKRTPADDRFAETFKRLRGNLGPDPDPLPDCY